MSSRAALKQKRKQWLQQAEARFLSREFVLEHVVPLVPELSQGARASDWSGEVVRAKRTGRMTLRYEFNDIVAIYGKAYDDGPGSNAYQLLQHLSQNGFGRQSEFRVPEPLGFIAAANMWLMRPARGVPLSKLLATGSMEQALDGVRAAARWLEKFHASEIPGLEPEPPCERVRIIKIAAQLARVAAACPEQAAWLRDLLQQLRRVAPLSNLPPRLVPLNGQFRPEHVFVDGNNVVVIDLEKIWLSDPAKDVALLLHKIKEYCFETGGDLARAERLAEEFVKEYRALAAPNLLHLSYFRAVYCLKSLANIVKKLPREPHLESVVALYVAEFGRCTEESAAQVAAAERHRE